MSLLPPRTLHRPCSQIPASHACGFADANGDPTARVRQPSSSENRVSSSSTFAGAGSSPFRARINSSGRFDLHRQVLEPALPRGHDKRSRIRPVRDHVIALQIPQHTLQTRRCVLDSGPRSSRPCPAPESLIRNRALASHCSKRKSPAPAGPPPEEPSSAPPIRADQSRKKPPTPRPPS